MTDRSPRLARLALALLAFAPAAGADDPIKRMQNDYVARKDEKATRAYHFGSQGAGDVYSNSTGHSNRLIPVYVFGRKADLGAVTGRNSRYRDEAKIRELYGTLPANTLNPRADYADQSDMYRVQKEAVEKGAKYLFTVWFDGMDWETTRAAAIAKTGRVYSEGKGSGLVFQDYKADGSAQFGFYVTSPTHDKNTRDVDGQAVTIAEDALPGGYDADIAGLTPWRLGPLGPKAPGYIRGAAATDAERAAIRALGRALHAVTDSAPSAAEFASGVKSYNDGVNVAEDGRFIPTLFNRLQEGRGWKVGTATSVPFNHVSPAAMYAHNVDRDDYQDLARDMLGLPGIAQESSKDHRHPGLDVVLGAGYGQVNRDDELKEQGKNAAKGQNKYLADEDRKRIDAENGGPYVVAQTKPMVNGARSLKQAAERAAREGKRLFGFYGTNVAHLPFRTADGGYDPANGIKGTAETYSAADRDENPTLADMTRAALAVLSAEKGRPFALFVEAGDVDFALHDNNLDNAVGAVLSGEEAVQAIIDWVEANSNWDESVLIVSADHGHYLVLDDPEALAAPARR